MNLWTQNVLATYVKIKHSFAEENPHSKNAASYLPYAKEPSFPIMALYRVRAVCLSLRAPDRSG
jgi:hypothetical protein